MNRISLKTTWKYFFNSNSRNSILITWITINYFNAILSTTFVPMVAMLLIASNSTVDSLSRVIDNIESYRVLVNYVVILLPFSFLCVVSMFLFFYINGSSLRNYEKLKLNFLNIETVDDQGKDDIRLKLAYGVKYSLVIFIYFLPLYLTLFLFFIGYSYILTKHNIYPENISAYLIPNILMSLFLLGYIIVVKYILRPSINNEILERNYLSALNPVRIIKRINKNLSEYKQISIFLLIPNLALLIMFFTAFVLTSIFVGYVILPILYGLSAILFIYVEPHIMAQAFHKK